MIRKEFSADQLRQKLANKNTASYSGTINPSNSGPSATATFIGNQRQMLQEIRESLSHLKKSEHSVNNASSRHDSMQIKQQDPLGLPVSNYGNGASTSNTSTSTSSGKPTRSTGYRQKALAEIRNSLLPYAAGTGEPVGNGTPTSAATSGSSSPSQSSVGGNTISLQSNGQDQVIHEGQLLQLLQHGYDEETLFKALNLSPGQPVRFTLDILPKNFETGSTKSEPINGLGHSGIQQGIKVIRKQSFEGRGSSPAGVIDGAASTRSDSPSLHLSRNVIPDSSPPPRPPSGQSESVMYARQYAPATFASDVPPPPPPRGAVSGPPPTPPRGATPPPPPLPPMPQPTDNRSQQQYGLASSQVHQMLRRMSPGSPARAPQVLSGHSSTTSQSSNSASIRGASPVSFSGRAPMIVQNTPQAQQQLQQQLQALNIYHNNSSIPAHQMEPPPPYPIGSAVQNPVSLPNKLPAPYSSSSSNLSRQSPTPPSSELSFSSSSVGSSLQGKRQPPPSYQSHVAINLQQQAQQQISTSPSSCMASPAITTVTTRPSALQARSARQAKTQPPIIMQSVKSTQVQKPVLQTAIAPMAPSVNNSNNNSPSPPFCAPYPPSRVEDISNNHHTVGIPIPANASVPGQANVPTTEPPSYASSIQALAAQRAGVSSNMASGINCGYNNMILQVPTNSPSSTSLVAGTVIKTPTPTPSETPSSVDSISTSQTASNLSLHSSSRTIQHTPLHRKFSPMAVDTVSYASRSESPISFMSNTTCTSSPPSTQSDSTQDSGIGRGNGPKSQDPSYKVDKVTHQSPIPQRKAQSREKDEERRETKVRNYSPAAFKFFMEQHVENLHKSHQEREHRRQQLEGEMAKVELSEDARHQMRLMLHQKESNYIRLKRAKMNKSMFCKIKTIGLGAFGEVALVRKIDTKQQYYAMKTLRKSDVLKRNQVAHVKAERDILAEADNEWVVKLYYSFQDKDNLYFVMDYIPGGDLMSLLIKKGIFEENIAKFYIAELVLAIQSVHKMGFIHRDIKPDNILIDKDGHIKLTDFGLCTGFRWTHNSKYYQNGEHQRQDSMDFEESFMNKCRCANHGLKPLERRRRQEHQRCLAHSLVGTPNYIAPEVLMRTGYTQLCDWWSVGVILYEMLIGQPPFLAKTPAETQFKVINWESSLVIPKPANFSQSAKALILELCCGPTTRLGKGGAEEVKNHKFFSLIDFEKGLRRQKAPYEPDILFPTDTSNFDPIDPDRLRNSSSSSDSNGNGSNRFDMGNKQENEHGFFEFTFRRFFDDGGHAYSSKIHYDENEGQNGPDPVYV